MFAAREKDTGATTDYSRTRFVGFIAAAAFGGRTPAVAWHCDDCGKARTLRACGDCGVLVEDGGCGCTAPADGDGCPVCNELARATGATRAALES